MVEVESSKSVFQTIAVYLAIKDAVIDGTVDYRWICAHSGKSFLDLLVFRGIADTDISLSALAKRASGSGDHMGLFQKLAAISQTSSVTLSLA